jgi:oxygen-independent coproporphyrinogen-3 oxidase
MAGIYVHIPFCKKRCSYCDFHFSTTFSKYRQDLISAICLELVLRKDELKAEFIETILTTYSRILHTFGKVFPVALESIVF